MYNPFLGNFFRNFHYKQSHYKKSIIINMASSAIKPFNTMTSNVAYVEPLYYISLLTGLGCPVDFENCSTRKNIFYNIYSFLLIIIVALLSGITFYGRVKITYPVFLETISYMDAMYLLLLVVSNIYSVVNQILVVNPNLNKYFDIIKEIDGHLTDVVNTKRKRTAFKFRFGIMHFGFILLCLYDSYAWISSYGYLSWGVYCFQYYMCYCILVMILQIDTLATAVKSRFKILNEKLVGVSLKWYGTPEFDPARDGAIQDIFGKENFKMNDLKLTDLIKAHDLLCDSLDLLNSTHGFNVVFLVLEMIFTVVMALNFALTVSTGMQPIPKHVDVPHIVISYCYFALWFGVRIVRYFKELLQNVSNFFS